jgi:beta-lactamase regulating signal transducer with metallopeptidase domain
MMPVEPARQVQSPEDSPARLGMNLGAWAISLWLVGMVSGLVVLLMGSVRLAWIAWRSERVEDPTWLRIAAEVSRDYELGRPLLLLRSSRQSILATWGVFRPQVLVPSGSDQWTEERIQVVLSHELAHVRRSDWLSQIVAPSARRTRLEFSSHRILFRR